LASIVGAHAFLGAGYTVAGEVPRPTGGQHPSICPYGLFSAADGFVQIAVGSDRLWDQFAAAYGLQRPEWVTNRQRVADRPAVLAAINQIFAGQTAAQLLATLDRIGIPAGRVRDLGEVYEWEQTKSQHLIIDVDHVALGPISLPGPPLRFEPEPAVTRLAPPTLDQHGAAIRAWLAETD
jgi:crotonobetainyl-CoA:carnitine CoA-transferase CaiB-like acyl-CoA transferase